MNDESTAPDPYGVEPSVYDETAQFCEVAITISVEEWQVLATSLWRGLTPQEGQPLGHVLLECCGEERAWIASDGNRLMVFRTQGPPPTGAAGQADPFAVAVNPRLFVARQPSDGVLRVSGPPAQRQVSLEAAGMVSSLPEHPGIRPDWRALAGAVKGRTASVETDLLRQALVAAVLPPREYDVPDEIIGELWIQGGQLCVTVPWHTGPVLSIELGVDDGPDTDPVALDLLSLGHLVRLADLPTMELVLPVEPNDLVGVRCGTYEAALTPYDELAPVREFLGQLLGDLSAGECPGPDADGDFVVEVEGMPAVVLRLTGGPACVLRLCTSVASGVDPNVDMYRELIAISVAEPLVSFLASDDCVWAQIELPCGVLDGEHLGAAMGQLVSVADRYRGLICSYFGDPQVAE